MTNKKIIVDEIDLLQMIITVWDNKLKIITIMLLIVAATLGYYYKQPPIYDATTEIRNISAFDEFKYQTFNSYIDKVELEKNVTNTNNRNNNINNLEENNDLFNISYHSFIKINKSYLLELFINELREGEVTRSAIKKFNLIDKKNYQNDEMYEIAVIRMASSIRLIPPVNKKNQNSIDLNNTWKIKFTTSNRKQWEEFLMYIERPININVQLYLKKVFQKLITNEKKLKKFKIEDLDQSILAAIDNYENKITTRLSFLNEQAQIARTLNLPKSNITGAQTFTFTDNNLSSNFVTEFPYYMRGYEMIEEEIRLIKNRTNKKAFMEELNILEKQKKNLLLNKNIDRLQNLINQTPIFNDKNFVAANISYLTTNFNDNRTSFNQLVLLSILGGLLMGILYVLVEKAIKSRR